MLLQLSLFIIIVFFFIIFGKKKGFNKLETLWLLYGSLIIIFLYCQKETNRLLLLSIILSFRCTRIPLLFTILILLCIIGGNYTFFRMSSLLIFYNGLNCDFNTHKIPNKPTIFMANYPANYIEYFVQGLLGDKVCLLVHAPAVKMLQFIMGKSRLIAIIEKEGQFSETQQKIKKKMDDGYHIFCYVERKYHNRDKIYDVDSIRSGIFSIAKNINATITPLVIDHIDHYIGFLDNRAFKIHVDETRTVENVEKEIKNVEKLYKKMLYKFSMK